MKIKNPFVISGYQGPEWFCDRAEETAVMKSAMENGRNLTLLAERRIGKTGLIHHFFNSLRGGPVTTIYVDIFATQNLAEFTHRFASAVIGSMDTSVEKALASASRFFKSIRPGVSVDPATGSQSFTIGLQPSSVEATLKDCFDYLAQRGPCVVAIDEFQQIAEYPEKGTEALLRSYVQFLPNTRFIFAGSRHHLMTQMFVSAKRPFYNSTQTLPLDRLDRCVYREFAQRQMEKVGLKLADAVFDRVFELFDGITWYVQTVLNRMCERQSVGLEDVGEVIESLLNEKTWEFGALLKSLPRGSARLIKAIAAAGAVKEPTGAEFLQTYAPGGASSVSLALKNLVDDELVYETEAGYVVYDRLLGIWLRRMNG